MRARRVSINRRSSRKAKFSGALAMPATATRVQDETSESDAEAPPLSADASPPPNAVTVQPSLAGDWHNMLVLLGLYTLQGIPIGLASSVPLFLMSRGASFSDQATFSLASWPYSLKLLWAPIVDALYTQRWHLGQRKSWIVPVQFVTGIIMIILGVHVDDVFGSAPEASAKEGGRIDVASLTASFFLLYLLVATQDIAVDGWALTMLRPENVGYASTANTVGQTVGITAAYGLLMALDSPDFCNAWIRAPLGWPSVEAAGIVTMSGFMQACGWVFLASTFALWAWKREAPPRGAPTTASTELAADGGHSTVLAVLPTEAEAGSFPVAAIAPAPPAPAPRSRSASAELEGDAYAFGRGGGSSTSASSRATASRGQGQRKVIEDGDGPVPVHAVGNSSSVGSLSVPRQRTPRGSLQPQPQPPDAAATYIDGLDSRQQPQRRGSRSSQKQPDDADVEADAGEKASLLTTSKSAVRGVGGAEGPAVVADSGADAGGLAAALAAVRLAYEDLGRVLRIPLVQTLVLVLVTVKAGFAVVDGASGLMVQARGVDKSTIAFFDVVSTPIQLALQLAVARATAGPKPLTLFLRAFPIRALCGLLWLGYIYGMLSPAPGDGSPAPSPSNLALGLLFLLNNVHSLVQMVQFVTVMAFFARISDPAIGGTYITLLNTAANLGSMWPRYLALNSIEWATAKACIPLPLAAVGLSGSHDSIDPAASCADAAAEQACAAAGGHCVTQRDGYFIMTLVSTGVCVAWYLLMQRRLAQLESSPRESWLIKKPVPAATGRPQENGG